MKKRIVRLHFRNHLSAITISEKLNIAWPEIYDLLKNFKEQNGQKGKRSLERRE